MTPGATITAILVVVGWIFQAGVIYAGFKGLRKDADDNRTWQNDHETIDRKRFLLTIGALAAIATKEQQFAIADLLKGAADL